MVVIQECPYSIGHQTQPQIAASWIFELHHHRFEIAVQADNSCFLKAEVHERPIIAIVDGLGVKTDLRVCLLFSTLYSVPPASGKPMGRTVTSFRTLLTTGYLPDPTLNTAPLYAESNSYLGPSAANCTA
jgi:hypothetical protein